LIADLVRWLTELGVPTRTGKPMSTVITVEW
jgi:hypothetical protein